MKTQTQVHSQTSSFTVLQQRPLLSQKCPNSWRTDQFSSKTGDIRSVGGGFSSICSTIWFSSVEGEQIYIYT